MQKTSFKLFSSITYDEYCEEMKNLNLLDVQKFSNQISKSHWAVDGGYGLIQIYYEYINVNYKEIIPVVNCLHGFFPGMNNDWVKASEASFKSLPALFIHNDSHILDFRKFFGSFKKFILIANPYYYILDNYSNHTISGKNKTGSVLFLPHSIGKDSILTYNIDNILEFIENKYQKYYPITFCIHPNDIKNNIIDKIQRKGFGIATNGGRHDPKFLHRFYWLTFNKQYALMFDISSHLELSVLSNLEIVRIPINIIYHVPINAGTNEITIPKKIYWPLFEQFYSNEINQNILKDTVKITTGKQYFLNSKQLKLIINDLEYYYIKSKNIINNKFYPYKLYHIFELYFINLKKIIKSIGLRLSGLRNQSTIFFSDTYFRLIENEKIKL
jgi:hypothetical protein